MVPRASSPSVRGEGRAPKTQNLESGRWLVRAAPSVFVFLPGAIVSRRCPTTRNDPWLARRSLKSVKFREAPKADAEFKPRFAEIGLSFPPDVAGAWDNPRYWGLPDDAFVHLHGLPRRAVYLLLLRLKVHGGLETLRPGEVLATHCERGPGWSQPAVGQATTCVPGMTLVILMRDDRTWRLSLASPVEIFRLMGMVLPPEITPADFTAQEVTRIAGDGFHLQSAVAFLLATLATRARPSTE